jgi:16S rRNA (guanine527-N7)-methyltransferase
MTEEAAARSFRLNELLNEAGLPSLDASQSDCFATYLALILRWNSRLNLTAIREEEVILRRHFVESIFCARALPAGIGTLLDFGSGAGFPGIPIALCRREIAVTLAESNAKKVAFLRESMRALGLGATIFAGRAEDLTDAFECVVLRAVDRMDHATAIATGLLASGGWLALMTTQGDMAKLQVAAGDAVFWNEPLRLPESGERVLALGHRIGSCV